MLLLRDAHTTAAAPWCRLLLHTAAVQQIQARDGPKAHAYPSIPGQHMSYLSSGHVPLSSSSSCLHKHPQQHCGQQPWPPASKQYCSLQTRGLPCRPSLQLCHRGATPMAEQVAEVAGLPSIWRQCSCGTHRTPACLG
jgi:hypothetical protein